MRRLLLEAGGDIVWQFFAIDAIDTIYTTICPALLGGQNAPKWLMGEGFSMTSHRRLKRLEVKAIGNDIFAHWNIMSY